MLLVEEPAPDAEPKLAIEQPGAEADSIIQDEPATNLDSGLQQINERLIAIGQHLMKSNVLLAAGSGNLDQTDERSGLGLSEDVQRASTALIAGSVKANLTAKAV
jgi:hypothetical protein